MEVSPSLIPEGRPEPEELVSGPRSIVQMRDEFKTIICPCSAFVLRQTRGTINTHSTYFTCEKQEWTVTYESIEKI